MKETCENYIDAQIQMAIEDYTAYTTKLAHGDRFEWVVPDIYYMFYHIVAALLYACTSEVRNNLDRGRILEHEASIKLFHNTFIGANATHPNIFPRKIYHTYVKLKELRVDRRYGLKVMRLELSNKEMSELLEVAEQFLIDASSFLKVEKNDIDSLGTEFTRDR